MDGFLSIYTVCFLISFSIAAIVCLLASLFKKVDLDAGAEPQKVHQGFVPRVGGIGVLTGLLAPLMLFQEASVGLFAFLIVSAIPVFLAGIIEDFTGLVPPNLRFVASLVSGSLFCFVTGYQISTVDVSALDSLLAIPMVSAFLTVFAIATMINAVNLIDGLNGLASATAIFMIAGFGVLANQFGDTELTIICFSTVFASLGFLVWNFPFGKIFLGDGGAYFLGFMLAGIAVVVPARIDEVSPFASLLIVMYPLYELLRTFVRRTFARGYRVFEPDDKHLHSLLYKLIASRVELPKTIQNSLSSVLPMLLTLLSCSWAIVFSNERFFLIVGAIGVVVIYETIMSITVHQLLRNG